MSVQTYALRELVELFIARKTTNQGASAILRDSSATEMQRPYRALLMASLSVTIRNVEERKILATTKCAGFGLTMTIGSRSWKRR